MFDRFLFFVPVVLVTVTHITRSATYPLVLAMSLDALYSYLTLWNPNHTLIWIFKKCFMPKQTKVTTCLSVHDWINWTTQHSYCLILFIFGGPCHLSSFKQCSGIVFFLFIQSWNQMNISGFVLSPRKHFKCLKSWVWISPPKPNLKPPPPLLISVCVWSSRGPERDVTTDVGQRWREGAGESGTVPTSGSHKCQLAFWQQFGQFPSVTVNWWLHVRLLRVRYTLCFISPF